MDILLFAPEYRPNLSNMIRSAEFYGFQRLYILDKNGLLDPPGNKVSRADMNHLARVWTAGAIEFIEILKVENLTSFLEQYPGRKLGTYVDPKARDLSGFQFHKNDLLIMGPEKEGLPNQILDSCDEKLFIPGYGQTECLNVSVSLGIFLYAASTQLAMSNE